MDDTPLNLCIGIDCIYCFLKSCKTIHAEEQHVLYAPIFQVIQHPQPELAGFIGPYSNAQDIFIAACSDAENDIGGTA